MELSKEMLEKEKVRCQLSGTSSAFCMTFTTFSLMCLKGKIEEQSVSFLL